MSELACGGQVPDPRGARWRLVFQDHLINVKYLPSVILYYEDNLL